jgi:hypothetical protein
MKPDSATASTDPGLSPRSEAFVVYDASSGDVLHVHHSVVFAHAHQGGESPEARALRLASTAGKGAAGKSADVIKVDPSELSGTGPMRVDVATRKLERPSKRP